MKGKSSFPSLRMQRLRATPVLRDLIKETRLSPEDLIMPLFMKAGKNIKQPIASMPGQYQWSLDMVNSILSEVSAHGIPAVILFGIPSEKDSTGTSASDDEGIVQQAVRHVKKHYPNLLVIADCCFCEYTDHGHCGVIERHGDTFTLKNDQTLTLLGQQAVSLAKAGADMIAPSGMMDGMVGAIRGALDAHQFEMTPILSYSVKYASAFYGPFRDAAEGAPMVGDRSSYQMDPANVNEAIREAGLDIEEGADMLMVKPAGAYLDIIRHVKSSFPEAPLCAYQVSGEYAMIKAAASQGWLNEEAVTIESLLAIKRAGADCIITYFALDVATLMLSR